MSDELNPAVPDSATAEGPETESEETVKQRKNGLYPGVSERAGREHEVRLGRHGAA